MKRFLFCELIIAMIAFTTDKPLLKRQFFLQIAYYLITSLVILGVLLLFFPQKSNNAPFVFSFFLLINIVRLIQEDKVHEIRFDEDNQELHFYSKGYLTKLRKMKTSFENMHVKKEDWVSKSKWLPKRKTLSVEILKKKTLVFSVNMNLDHFSEQKMRALIATFESFNIPVKA